MKLSPRLRRWLIITASVVTVYALLGFFVAPPIVRSQMEKRAATFLHRPVKVAKVKVNPFTMSITVDGLAITDHDGAELASWERIYANFDPLTSLFRRQWHLGEVQVKHPRKRLVIAADGTLNIADLFPAASGAPANSTPGQSMVLPAVGIGLLQVADWEVDFTDLSHRKPYHSKAGPLSYELRNFSTKPGRNAPYAFTGSTDSTEYISWSGTISAVPLGSRGRIEIRNTSLPQQTPFLDKLFAGDISAGRVSQIINYEFALDGTITARITDSTYTVDNLDVRLANAADTAVAMQKLEVHVAHADLIARTAEVSRVAITGLDAEVARLADGSIDLLSLLPSTSATPAESASDPGPAPSVHVAEIALIDARLRVTDHTTPRPGTLVLDQINVTATNVGTDFDREIKLDAKARWDGSGTLRAQGVVRAMPLTASLDLQGDGITLRPLDPWIEPAANIRIASGTEHFDGHVEVSQSPAGRLALTWTGDSGIADLSVVDGLTGGELLAWKALNYSNTRFNLDPLEIAIGEVALVAPAAYVTIDENGALNLAAIRPAATTTATETPSPTPPPTAEPAGAKTSEIVAAATRKKLPFAAKIDVITISDGRFSFRDRSLPGGFSTALRDFGGTIKGLSSTELARADVDLSGSLDGVAPLRIKGSINPLANDRFSDVAVTFSNVDLPLFTPYGARFLGKKIQKGKLRVDVAYKISQNVLEAENHILFDQFYLGEPVASPDALKLPVGLALALLRDREGKINLDVPIRGNLDDPDFKYGRVVVQVIGNVITKAATAPFALLGGMFGGKDQDLSYVDFASGSAELGESAVSKLDLLAKSLYERPALRLEISSPAAPDGDHIGLRDRRFVTLLLAERQAVATAFGAVALPPPADTPFTAEETEVLVRSWFARQFPEEAAAAQAATGALAAPVVAEKESSKPGLFSRIVGSIFGGGEKPAPAAPTPELTAAVPADVPPALTLEEMQARLEETITITDAEFQELAATRARVIRDRLLADGKVEPERVFLVTEPKVPEGANSATDGGRVFFGLE